MTSEPWVFLVTLIYLLESNRNTYIYKILSSDYWMFTGKLNMSVYMTHFIVLPYLVERSFEQLTFINSFMIIVFSVGNVIFCYITAIFFYILVEYPFAVLQQKVMERLR